MSRSGSWKFYDPVNKVENIYNDLDPEQKEKNEGNMSSNDSEFSTEIRNSLYENHEVVTKMQEQQKNFKCRESVILQFDPLRTQTPVGGKWIITSNFSFCFCKSCVKTLFINNKAL